MTQVCPGSNSYTQTRTTHKCLAQNKETDPERHLAPVSPLETTCSPRGARIRAARPSHRHRCSALLTALISRFSRMGGMTCVTWIVLQSTIGPSVDDAPTPLQTLEEATEASPSSAAMSPNRHHCCHIKKTLFERVCNLEYHGNDRYDHVVAYCIPQRSFIACLGNATSRMLLLRREANMVGTSVAQKQPVMTVMGSIMLH